MQFKGMVRRAVTTTARGFMVCVALTGLVACASIAKKPVVGLGDEITVDYTCRLATGEVIATSSEQVTRDDKTAKSPVFAEPLMPGPVMVTAGRNASESVNYQNLTMETAITDQLRDAVINMHIGESRTVELKGTIPKELKGMDRYLRMNRMPKENKERVMSGGLFKWMFQQEPEIGKVVYSAIRMPYCSAEVLSVYEVEEGSMPAESEDGENTVEDRVRARVRFSCPVGVEVETPFGNALVKDLGNEYGFDTQVQKGRLIRVGDRLVRVTEVDEKNFTLDFGDPFGGEILTCEIFVKEMNVKAQNNTPAMDALSTAFDDAQKNNEKTVTVDVDRKEEASPKQVQLGDVVTVDYTASLENGDIFWTTRESIDQDAKQHKVPWYQKPKSFGPEEILAGQDARIRGIAPSVLGMAIGETKQFTVGPENAYGPRDPKNTAQKPCVETTPVLLSMTKEAFRERFHFEPEVGLSVPLSPHFESRVDKVTEENVAVTSSAQDRQGISGPLGTTDVQVDADQIVAVLTPKIGTTVAENGRIGRIIDTDGKTYTVDFNHPLAGEAIVLNIDVISLKKADSLGGGELPWLDDHPRMLETAKNENKPVVLVLYTPACPWCKKLFNETMTDPRIRSLKDEFIWGKINVLTAPEVEAAYGAKGYPLTLVLNAKGEVVKRINGYTPAMSFASELKDAFPPKTTAGDTRSLTADSKEHE